MVPNKKMDLIEKRIRTNCQECEGSGCITCKSQVSRCKSYSASDIPMDYWMLAIKDFEGDANFKKYIISRLSDINEMYENGGSLAFVGNLGTGKTYAACCILKMAIVRGYSARYVNMADIVNELVSSKTDNSTYLASLIDMDFLVIDEFDKRWVFPSDKAEHLFGQTLEHVLRCRFQNYMPTILCSNTENIDEVLSEDFSRAFSSLRSQYMKVLYVGGKDFRKSS